MIHQKKKKKKQTFFHSHTCLLSNFLCILFSATLARFWQRKHISSNHFYCDELPGSAPSCSNTHLKQTQIFASAGFAVIASPLLVYYLNMFSTILEIQAAVHLKKCLNNKKSHLHDGIYCNIFQHVSNVVLKVRKVPSA